MESIMAKALETTLKYWFKSFTRDQFKLQGHTVHLANLDINGDVLHASLGLPHALTVSMAKLGKLEIVLPYLSNVQLEPIVLQIDKLDVVLEENDDLEARRSTRRAQSASSSTKGSGYGFAEKIADGMMLQVQTVSLLLETHGGGRHLGGATWASPMASITIRNLVLYTTNENWQVINLKAARGFSSDKNFIYVFKKLEWECLCIDLLPHPDMFADPSGGARNRKDDYGAKRVFFGGERFIDGVSGEAYITIQRTDLNSPLGLELRWHITEAICPALSEPGLRALVRFFTGLYVCLNRSDANAQEPSAEAAGRTIVSFMVDHIFLCIKDADFKLELLMQSLLFSRTSVSDGASAKFLTQIMIGGLILRDGFSRPPCPLVQPSMQDAAEELLHIPDFGKNFCPPIYPLGDKQWRLNDRVPLISLHCLRFMPSLSPPSFTSQTVIDCKPLTIHLQEESCIRISSFLADGVMVNPGDILPDFSINSLQFSMKKLDITVTLEAGKPNHPTNYDHPKYNSFSRARLHLDNLYFSESPFLRLGLLNLDMDAACFCMWEGQPIDASQKRWTAGSSLLGMSLETCNNPPGVNCSRLPSSEFWRCVEMNGVCIQVAMVTADGSPLVNVPPPGGVVRVGIAFEQYVSNTSVEQLFFVLDLYAYINNVHDKMAMVRKRKGMKTVKNKSSDSDSFSNRVPADAAISLTIKNLKLTFLESSSTDLQGKPLVQFTGDDLLIQVTHRTLGAAMATSSTLRWERVQVDCAETDRSLTRANGLTPAFTEDCSLVENSYPELRAVFWVQNRRSFQSNGQAVSSPFLNLSIVHVIPYNAHDIKYHSLRVSACIAGVRLAGGMNYNEALLLHFGILGPGGGPGAGLSKGLEHLSSGPLSKLFKASPPFVDEVRESQNESIGDDKNGSYLNLGAPHDVNILLELKDWIFALEGAEIMAERHSFSDSSREERSWHTSFESFKVRANGSRDDTVNGKGNSIGAQNYPVEVVRVGVEGLKTLKPQRKKNAPSKGVTQTVEPHEGVDLEVEIVPSEDNGVNGTITWGVEDLKITSKQPIDVVIRKDELQHVARLCKLEIDSMGRIAVGILRFFKLDGPVAQPALDQLSHLGSEGIEEIFSPRKGSSGDNSIGPGDPFGSADNNCSSIDSTLASLEATLLDSQSICSSLSSEVTTSNLHTVQQLSQKLESMHRFLMKLRNQV
ncbi:uncharacterized protein LOC112514213 [Cynara cardunculus var. scolymus]|uniref:uncharacterized protein LOC112514213 n=1 Tax=Cynara cardunculus var. scolymus TaxID=59895 RepID=UPI000D62FBF9|nr:uncharacterized protein LOC112514213 [Cynara cardunculus var. scolymus]